ncbi:MAG: methyltransferase domain-containing protein [Bacteroidetes bacterium]|nr:MAG: methyltransferase domain-containing protein [Bacteroidota bacterium]
MRHRSTETEIMDDPTLSGAVISQTLRELDTINRWLGGNAISQRALRQLLREVPRQPLHLVDLGCGGGDILKTMARWARRQGWDLRFTGIDANPHIVAYARENCRDFPEIDFRIADIFAPDFAREQFDIVHSSLFLHHFPDEALIRLLRQQRQQARLGILINDLHRHPLAYHSFRLLTWVFPSSEMTRHDGALSVTRSFRRAEWRTLLQAAGLTDYRLRWAWAFRWQLVIRTGDRPHTR